MRDLSPGRLLETSGLPREELTRLIDLIDNEIQPGERLMWLAGGISFVSPAAIHLALYQRHGDRAHFLNEAKSRILITDAAAVDPAWGEQRLVDFASGFDVVFATRPPDLRGRNNWDFLEHYRQILFARPEWYSREIGTVEIARPPSDPQLVQVFAARRR